MDLMMAHLLIKKRKSSHRFFIEEKQYSLKEVMAYLKLHPGNMVHIQTIEEEAILLDAYVPTNQAILEKIITLAAKAKVYKSF